MNKFILFGLATTLAIGLSACGRPLTSGEQGALIGGGTGALVGGIAGGGTGAAIGAAGGALTGGLIGHYTGKKCKVYYKNGKCKSY